MKTPEEILKLAEFDMNVGKAIKVRALIEEDPSALNKSLKYVFAATRAENQRLMPLLQELADQLKLANEEREELYASLIEQEHRMGTRIEILEKERGIANERAEALRVALEFYASRDSWSCAEDYDGYLISGLILTADTENLENGATFDYGGKLARAAINADDARLAEGRE